MKKIKCLLVDDEPLALDLLESYVRKTPFLQLVGRCSNAFDAMETLDDEKAELLFLDIQMPELTGIELIKSLQNGPKVIFTTAFEQYALEGFKVDALDYLLKPFNYEEFLKAANKARTWFDMAENKTKVGDQQDHYIFVKSEYKLIKIDLRKILYIEGLKDYVKIYLSDHEKPVFTLMSLKLLNEKLPVDHFMRVHRSFIVNLDQVQTVERNSIVFGKTKIPISDNYKETFQEFLAKRFLD